MVRSLVVCLLVALGLGRPARAQCSSNASSCVVCHEQQRQHPVLGDATPWHRDHGFADLCGSCHGGDCEATTLAGAHSGLRRPLADATTSCAGCHQQGLDALVARYGAHPPAPAPASSPPPAPAPAGASRADLILAAVALVLGLAIASILWRRRRGAGAMRPMAWLRAAHWSPLVAGAGLGLVVAIAEVGSGRPIAVAGAFDRLAAYPGRALFPDSQYYTHVISPGISWQVWMVIGLLAGSFLASRLAGNARARWLPDSQWVPRFGARRRTRLAFAFCGAVLVQLGAGIAGGCTSGLAISGGALLAPAAFLFMAGMFGGGIPTARILYRGRT